jgi:hypothetical protein
MGHSNKLNITVVVSKSSSGNVYTEYSNTRIHIKPIPKYIPKYTIFNF